MGQHLIKENLKQTYNSLTIDTKRNNGQISKWKLKLQDKFLKIIKAEEKETLLDLGSGSGNGSLFFQKKGLNVTAVDLSEEMVRLCTQKNIEAYEMDFYDLYKINHIPFDMIVAGGYQGAGYSALAVAYYVWTYYDIKRVYYIGYDFTDSHDSVIRVRYM